ncbi:leucyl aminopeptidase [Methylocapsa acidiphila]|uniref:leucyl aminopeptidase n=1 Tax=Methylocapsa acidiphila TaxID=133552 RepID=UPI00047B4C89|nr:leucyl aminopeptidase [Methylocapsa acidiphila]
MPDSIKIEFVALAPLNAQTPLQPTNKRAAGKAKGAQTLVVFMGPDFTFGPETLRLIGPEGAALIKKAAAAVKFKGKASTALDILAPSGFAADRLLVIGISAGPAEKSGAANSKEAKEDIGQNKGDEEPAASNGPDYAGLGGFVLGRLGRGANAVIAFDPPRRPADPAAAAAEFLLGMQLRDYRFDTYKTKKKDESEDYGPGEIFVAVEEPAAARREAKAREAVAEGALIARGLVNEPANVLYPVEFANRAKTLEKLGVEVEIFDEAKLRELGMGALLGVGQGSARESRVVIMRWRGGKPARESAKAKSQPIAFVGKGVCFDTGGISIKPAAGMEDMKGDMAGAACVVGLIHALAARKAKVDVVGAIGLVENMPGPEAQRPGDIVKSMSGQTIEVINTDAEGRLVLADVLWHVQDKFKPKFIVDLATLTGAILVALGQEHAGLFTNDDALAEKLLAAGKATGEKLWRLPLGPAYDKMIDSKFADMKNTGGRHAGSITAAQFLQRFVNGTPWAHLDIAGTGMNSPANDINQGWASGFGVRLLDRLVADNYEG